MKRLFDIVFSTIGLIVLSPIILVILFLIWIYDLHNPFYMPLRVGKKMKVFRMYKFRSMVINADKTGVSSTSVADKRITPIGRVIRRYKLDEISQLINVFLGSMSIVGPRPQVVEHVNNEYTLLEKKLLDVKPGITDISSIVFSNEGDILKDSKDPDADYNLLIRPWKSRLGLLYVRNNSFSLDVMLIVITIIAIFNKKLALRYVNKLLVKLAAPQDMIDVCRMQTKLVPSMPPQ